MRGLRVYNESAYFSNICVSAVWSAEQRSLLFGGRIKDSQSAVSWRINLDSNPVLQVPLFNIKFCLQERGVRPIQIGVGKSLHPITRPH